MKHKFIAAFLCTFSLSASSAYAELLALNFQLDAPTPSVNTVPITVSVSVDTGLPFIGTVTDSDTDNSTVSGNALANLNLSFNPLGQVSVINTIAFTGGRVRFDDNLSLNLSYPLNLASASITTTNLSGQLGTPTPPGPVTGNTFNLNAHALTLNQGTLTAVGSGLASDVNQTVNFATAPLLAPLTGSASISVVLNQIIHGTGFYTATINAPFSLNQAVPVDDSINASLATSATLIARAQFSRQIFHPADLDQDADVDDADFGLSFAAFTGPGNASDSPADLDDDNDVDDADFGLSFAAFTGPGSSSAVPEPASLMTLALAGLCVLGRMRSEC